MWHVVPGMKSHVALHPGIWPCSMHLPPLLVLHLKPHFRHIDTLLNTKKQPFKDHFFPAINLGYKISAFAGTGLKQMKIYRLKKVIRQAAIIFKQLADSSWIFLDERTITP